MSRILSSAALGLAFCVVTEITRELCFKAAANRAQDGSNYVLDLARQPVLWLGLAFWISETIALVRVLEIAPLSVAYQITTLPYAGIPIAGALVFRERLTRGQVAGAVLIGLGVILVGASGL
ncbi:permease [Caulobacter sp. FWC2]|uniref:permease n=1 Tax=Caulobacter sp. FWC2 TaxID=69664 RepID=UPI000C14AB9E|nr:permease [Caulobacter sp. FWC2]PIB92207.1 permease [Caulobacter sp. FWC2]